MLRTKGSPNFAQFGQNSSSGYLGSGEVGDVEYVTKKARQRMALAAAPGKCILVTGPPGVGKTTLITRLFDTLKASSPNVNIQGFYTRMLSLSLSHSRLLQLITYAYICIGSCRLMGL
ncbi:cancer-related nucleoside-triphosphatase [Tripterygium wilfordii]|uniref:Cancer-related nucleoside-triphosphatase n=1 Tax=Tripterygium wilfordii TaxID=458696 RepID=A0A7J7E3K3_TRIWF|nr:cancer-related nucleoside-triphosphatase [Tripterygium wilfordii]